MIEQVIDEIIQAEKEAQQIIKAANDQVANINIASRRVFEKVKQKFAADYKKENDYKRAEAERKGDIEAENVLIKARAAADKVKAESEENSAKAVDFILSELLSGK